MKMLPRTEHVYCDLPGHIHVFKVVPPVPSNFRKWAVDGEALEVHGNGPPLEQFVFQISGAGRRHYHNRGRFSSEKEECFRDSACGGSSSCYTGMELLGPLVVGVHM